MKNLNGSATSSEIFQARTAAEIEAVRVLFSRYADWLGADLWSEDFQSELAALPGRYAPPMGRILLATLDGEIAGCAALRKIGADVCEMKRLFVLPEFRANDVGKNLILTLIEEAREIGYAAIRLDTLPARMTTAVKLYEALGFEQIERYNDTPFAGTMFLELKLRR